MNGSVIEPRSAQRVDVGRADGGRRTGQSLRIRKERAIRRCKGAQVKCLGGERSQQCALALGIDAFRAEYPTESRSVMVQSIAASVNS